MNLLHLFLSLLLSLTVNTAFAQTATPSATLAPTPTPTSTELGGMDLDGWCASQNEGTASLNTNKQWVCTGNNQVINFTANPTPNCVWQYKNNSAFAQDGLQPSDPNYPYDWACFAPSGSTTPTPTATPTPAQTPTPTTVVPTPTPGSATDDWATYKYDDQRSAYNSAETIINASSVPNLTQKLDLPCQVGSCNAEATTPGGSISDAPAIVNNVMYYGDWSGNFYARNVSNGSIIWQRNLGTMTPPAANGCSPLSVGVVSGASVRTISVNGVETPIVYITGADGNMYALYASNGNILWKDQLVNPSTGALLWDSPLEANGSVYIGTASFGDCPLVQGREWRLNWRNGSIQAEVNIVPNGCIGGGEWGSPTYDQADNKIYISTATQDDSCKVNGKAFVEPNALAMVELDGTTLQVLGAWRIPASEQGPDSDFGVSPALTTGKVNGVTTKLVSAANKNGRLYIFKRDAISAGPIYDLALSPNKGGTCPDCSEGSISTGVTDGAILYQAMGGCGETPSGTEVFSNCYANGFNSEMAAINPGTGQVIWKTLIAKQIVSTPILLKDVIIIFTGNNVEILARSNGAILKTITPAGAASVFDGSGAVARGQLFFGDLNGNFYEYGI